MCVSSAMALAGEASAEFNSTPTDEGGGVGGGAGIIIPKLVILFPASVL